MSVQSTQPMTNAALAKLQAALRPTTKQPASIPHAVGKQVNKNLPASDPGAIAGPNVGDCSCQDHGPLGGDGPQDGD